MKKGKIKFYNLEKGYGFIIPEDGSKEVFFHVSGLGAEYKPEKDNQVIYNESNAVRGVIAIDIVPQ